MNKSECLVGCCGLKIWQFNDQIHREDGPAIEYPNGKSYWFLNDKILNPIIAINNIKLRKKYPILVASMIVYLVHKS